MWLFYFATFPTTALSHYLPSLYIFSMLLCGQIIPQTQLTSSWYVLPVISSFNQSEACFDLSPPNSNQHHFAVGTLS
ncbi:hypothetical protein FKM82_016540 [Ascaphus truei]